MSMMVSFVLSFFPRDVLDEILNLVGSVSEGFPSYSSYQLAGRRPKSLRLAGDTSFNIIVLIAVMLHELLLIRIVFRGSKRHKNPKINT